MQSDPLMTRNRLVLLWRTPLAVGLSAVVVAQAAAGPPAAPTYWKDIRPLFRRHCTACHSARNLRELDVSGGLALDTYDALRKAKRPLFQAGKSGSSLLVHLLVTDDADKRMPLAATPLSADAIALVRRWIDTGAKEGVRI